LASKFQFITELYSRTLTRLTGDYESWTGFLRSACYNYKCPFDEQVLIYAQRPDATAVLELEKWNRQFGRWVNAGATGIAVMDEVHGKGRLKHYFDITDTHATRISRPVPVWSMEPAYTEPVIETLEATFGTLAEKDNLPDAILSASRNAVADNMQDYLRDLLDCRDGSMLEELDALNVEVTYRRALESSVAYMLLTRLSLPAAAYILPEDFEGIYSFDTPGTINALGIATSDIAEMGLREISRTVMQARREQNFAKDAQIGYDAVKEQNNAEKERSAEHGSDLQSAGGLSPAEPAAAPRAGDAPGQVRGAAEAVHQEAPQGAVYESQDQRSVGGTSGGDRDGGGEDGDAAGGADGAERGRDGGTESRRSPALDGADEQPEAQRGGNGAERPDLQLNSTDENAGSAELPAFLDEHLIEAILLDDGGRKHTRQEIFAHFQTNRDIATRTEFLKSSYNDIWVEVLAGADKVRVGYHAEKDGLLMWEGSYLSRTAESVFSWGVVTEMTENLIERGAYKIKLGLQNAPVMAEQMSLFGMNGGTAVYEVPETQRTGELFPTRTVPQAVIDQTLYTAGNSRGSAERIAVFYMRQRPEAECIAFLRREFGAENGRGIEYEGKKYAVWFMEDGIHLAQGDSIRAGHCRTTVTWEQASARILELLEAGTYLSAPELEQAQDKALLEMGDALLMTARDLTEEGRTQGLFSQTLAIHDQRKGYPELDEDMVAFAKSEGGLAPLAEEYHDFLRAYEQNRSIMRFRLSEYNTHRIGVVLDGIDLPERSFTAQPDFLRRCKMFITQDEIDQFFLADSVDSKLAVYSFFCYPHAKEERQKFIKSRFGEYSGGGRDGYDYSRITGEWRIEGKSKDSYNVKAYSTYGTSRASAYDIIESSLNLKDVRIFDYQYDPDGRRVAVLNKKETAIAQSKQELLKEAFSEWIWKDPERREKICKAYNILFNSNRPREYDGSHINFSGMNPEITLRKHQVNAIAHILYGGNTLLAHVVGAGKTFEMVAAAMESKRLGLCQKSLFVVPNHLTEQWASEFLQLYPAANVLVATKKDFETKNRKRFCGRIATGDYDAVIIGHSQFEKIPVSIQRQRVILEQQMDEIILGIREAKADKAENFTIKQMEKTRKGLQNKLDKLNDQSRKDDVVTFEELGVDRLFIDESHYYKNLFLYTKMRNVSGIAQTEAQKSSDLFMKCRYLDEITGGRGVVFATGTPISNSMVELYTIQRYLQMGALQEQGFQHFDAWAANYGETVTAIELAPEGYTLIGR